MVLSTSGIPQKQDCAYKENVLEGIKFHSRMEWDEAEN
jgi:hypothetical protein